MRNLFVMGGFAFMAFLTLLLITLIMWMLYHFIYGYKFNQNNNKKVLKRIEYGKSIGLFAMITGFLGQFVGLVSMFQALENVVSRGDAIKPEVVFHGIRTTMITPIYGILIFLFSLLLWFVATILIGKKHTQQLTP